MDVYVEEVCSDVCLIFVALLLEMADRVSRWAAVMLPPVLLRFLLTIKRYQYSYIFPAATPSKEKDQKNITQKVAFLFDKKNEPVTTPNTFIMIAKPPPKSLK